MMGTSIHTQDQEMRTTEQGTHGRGTLNLTGPRIHLTWLLLSLAVVALVVLAALSLLVSMGLSNRVNDLEHRLDAEDSQVVNALLQLRVLSFWLAYTTDEPLLLEPPSGIGNSQGVLRVVDDGLSAVVMVAGMQQLQPTSFYQVWLTNDDQRVQAGQVRVDPNGWGATTIYLDEPILGYDSVEVTAETEGGLGSTSGPRVLVGKIVPGEASN